MSKKGNILEWITVSFTIFFVFFGYVIPIPEVFKSLSILILGLAVICYTKKNKLKYEKMNNLWLLYIILMSFSLIYSVNFEESFKYLLIIICLFIFKICIDNFNNIKDKVEKAIFYIGIIHIFFTIMYTFLPTFVQEVAKLLLNSDGYLYNISLYRYGCIAGICSEHGINAIFISIYLAVVLSNMVKKFNIKNCLLAIIGIIALLLTGKRGPLIANILAFIVIFVKCNINNKKMIKTFFVFAIFGCGLIFVLKQVPQANFVFERFQESFEEDNVLNGRDYLYGLQLESINENTILGIGIRGVMTLTNGNDGHNIYLQVLCELGLLGFTVIIIIILGNVFSVIKKEPSKHVLISLYYQVFFIIDGITGNPLYLLSTLIIYFIFTSNNFIKREEKENEGSNINIS